MSENLVTLFLAGDVMTGRGVDQILPGPGDPRLWETFIEDARDYVTLTEARNGPVPQPADYTWPWGDALPALDDAAPDLRLVNLETAVTTSSDVALGKAVNYRMSPANIGCLTAARLDVCSLANNHVLDFGVAGLIDTLDHLAATGVTTVGAGRDEAEARRPVAVAVPVDRGGGRVLVVGCAHSSSGVPPAWAAGPGRPGVNLLPDLSDATAERLLQRLATQRRPGDLVVVSVHWGGNWGYAVAADERRFAHRLVDGGVDVVHGHSSHHPRPAEVYRDRLVLYGCGDLIDDYEGIRGHETYRPDLRLLYLVALEPGSGRLVRLHVVPLQAHRMRLRHASDPDVRWLRAHRPLGDVIRSGLYSSHNV